MSEIRTIYRIQKEIDRLKARETPIFTPTDLSGIEAALADLQVQIDAIEASITTIINNTSGGVGASYSIRTELADTSNDTTITWDTILCDCSAGDITVTLLAKAGQIVNVTKIDSSSNVIILSGSAGALVNGEATQTILFQWSSAKLQSNGVDWFIQ